MQQQFWQVWGTTFIDFWIQQQVFFDINRSQKYHRAETNGYANTCNNQWILRVGESLGPEIKLSNTYKKAKSKPRGIGERFLVALELLLERMLEEKAMQKHICFVWMNGWMAWIWGGFWRGKLTWIVRPSGSDTALGNLQAGRMHDSIDSRIPSGWE